MLNVRGNLLNNFFTDSITIERRTFAINDYGENSFTTTTIDSIASVQPTVGKELEFLPDFVLESETITIFCLDPLYSESDNGTGYSDVVTYDSHRYQVMKSKKWKTHYEAVAILEAYSE